MLANWAVANFLLSQYNIFGGGIDNDKISQLTARFTAGED